MRVFSALVHRVSGLCGDCHRARHCRRFKHQRHISRNYHRGRRKILRRIETHLAVLRRGRAELRLHEGRKKIAVRTRPDGRTAGFFRAHHLLTSGDGAYSLKFGSSSTYKEDTNGTLIYDWSINDKIFDTYLARGVKPYAQIGFMPEALPTHPQNYPHNPPVNKMAPVAGGQSYPPKDYAKWGELVYQWTKHCVEKYGADEVNEWYWEVWNEANISYWHGTAQDYCKLYDYAVDGARRRAGSCGRGRDGRDGVVEKQI